jgi:hypothetical protein
MNLSYQEKSIWGSMIGTLLMCGYYFATGHLIFSVVMLIVVEIIYNIALAIRSVPEPKDERDRLIEAKAYRNAYLALVTGVVGNIFVPLTPVVAAQIVFGALVASEVAKSVTQLYYYRKGV